VPEVNQALARLRRSRVRDDDYSLRAPGEALFEQQILPSRTLW